MGINLYRVDGMSCGGCLRHVEKALMSVPGVSSVQVDLTEKTAKVEGEAPYETLARAVEEAGYVLLRRD